MNIPWRRDIDQVLDEARGQQRPVLLDFSAVPICAGCARLDAEVYPDERVARFIMDNFIPARVNVREQTADFKRLQERYGAQWAPTILELDPDGTERHRIEGFLPADDFLAQLNLGLGHAAFNRKDWKEAERQFHEVAGRYPDGEAAPEALYWEGVARYRQDNDAAALIDTARTLAERYAGTSWAKKASVWAGPAPARRGGPDAPARHDSQGASEPIP